MIHELHTPSDGWTSAKQEDPPPLYVHVPPISLLQGACNTPSTQTRVVCHMHLHGLEYLQDESLVLYCTRYNILVLLYLEACWFLIICYTFLWLCNVGMLSVQSNSWSG
jgi:hypothetical protein